MRQPAARASYWETVSHGLFHLLAIIIAFIISNAWVSREAELKDLGEARYWVGQLNQDIKAAKDNIETRMRPGGAQCAEMWTEHDLTFPNWRAVTSDQTVVSSLRKKDSTLVDNIQSFYGTVLPRQLGRARSDCSGALSSLHYELVYLWNHMNGYKNESSGKMMMGSMDRLDQNSRDLATTTTQRVVELTLAGVAIVFVLPPALRALEVVFRSVALTASRAARHTARVSRRLRLGPIVFTAENHRHSVEKDGTHVTSKTESAQDVEAVADPPITR